MKQYQDYMDHIKASDTLHQKLVGLDAPAKRPRAWKKYGTLAAALVLVCGAGGFSVWAAGAGRQAGPTLFNPADYQTAVPEISDVAKPDIAPAEPGDGVDVGPKTIGGYEVRGEDRGPDTVVTYYPLFYIDYGDTGLSEVQACLDWDIPQGASKQELSREEIARLLGGEDVLSTHLDWGGYELSGWAAWYENGDFWGAYFMGHAGPLDHFEFAVTAGQLPPTCIVYPSSVEQEVYGLPVTADGHDSVATPQGGVDASTRRVSFMNDGYGYRFDLTGASRALTEERVSRLVRWVADKGTLLVDGTTTCSICGYVFPAGAEKVHVHSFVNVGEPNRNGGVDGFDSDCPYCADGTAHTHPYNPQEAADPSYNAPGGQTCPECGVYTPAGVEHYHTQDGGTDTVYYDGPGENPRDRGEHWCGTQGADPGDICPDCGSDLPFGTDGHSCQPDPAGSGGYACKLCGQVFPAGEVHSHELCVLPPAPTPGAHTCPVCGQELADNVEHSHPEDGTLATETIYD